MIKTFVLLAILPGMLAYEASPTPFIILFLPATLNIPKKAPYTFFHQSHPVGAHKIEIYAAGCCTNPLTLNEEAGKIHSNPRKYLLSLNSADELPRLSPCQPFFYLQHYRLIYDIDQNVPKIQSYIIKCQDI